MGCINVHIKNLTSSLQVEMRKLGGVDVTVDRVGTSLISKISDALAGKHLKVSLGVVCTIPEMHYLKVSPREVQWITPDEAIIYMVESDTSWTIETS